MRAGERAELAKETVETFERMKEAGFKLLIRADGLEPVGLITQSEYEWNRALGDNRILKRGLRLDQGGDITPFEEYMDWVNPLTGELELCKALENGLSVVTARDGFGVEDDPDNFTWLTDRRMNATVRCPNCEEEVECASCGETVVVDNNFSFRDSKQMKHLLDKIGILENQVSDLKSKKKEERTKREEIEKEAEEKANKADSLADQNEELVEENQRLRQQVDHYESILMKDSADKVAEAATEEEEMKRAEEEGRFRGKDRITQTQETLEEISDLQTSRSKVEDSSDVEETVSRLEKTVGTAVDELGDKVEDLERRIDGLSDELAEVRGS